MGSLHFLHCHDSINFQHSAKTSPYQISGQEPFLFFKEHVCLAAFCASYHSFVYFRRHVAEFQTGIVRIREPEKNAAK